MPMHHISKRPIFAGLLLCCPLLASHSQAEINTHLSTFGSIGAGRVLSSGGEYDDYNTQWSYDNDTVVGGQIDIASSQGVTFTTQAVARGYDVSDVEATYEPDLELLFLAYQATDNLRLRGGLIRTPFFIHSESIEVGYAYPWVRPPADVYNPHAQAVTHMKGIDASYYHPVGDAMLEWRLVYGSQESRIETPAFSYDIDLEPLMGSTLTLNWNEWLLRYSISRVSSTFVSDELAFVQHFYRQLAAEDPVFSRLATNVSGRNQTTLFHVLGAQYESAGWTLTTEIDYEPAPKKQFSVGLMGAYVSIAKQVGKFSPYTYFSYSKSEPSDYLYSDLEASEAVIATGVNGLLDVIRRGTHQGYDAVNFTNYRQAVGLRYDINDHLDFKAEIENFSINRTATAAELPDHQKMLTFLVDWVF